MSLGLKPGESLVNNRSIDPESYQQYLRAGALIRARNLPNLNTAVGLLDQVVACNPGYAPGWALLAIAHNTLPNYYAFGGVSGTGRESAEELRPIARSSQEKTDAAARKALQLDPGFAEAYVTLAGVMARTGKFLAAEELMQKAAENGDHFAVLPSAVR